MMTMPTGLLDVDELKRLIEDGLAALPLGSMQPRELYEPLDYILALKAKRMRPLLVLGAYQALSEQPPKQALPIALAVELFHNFTLIHDDIMDNAPTRRGQPTVHEKWGANTAILGGDAMFAYSMQLLTQPFREKAAELVAIYTRTALAVCEGQMEDMALADAPNSTVEAYLAMIRKKTAALLGGSLQLGAAAAGASAELQSRLAEFGELLGTAFQLQDDYLDCYADAEKFGKQVGGDIIENKKTYLWLRAFQKGSKTHKELLLNWCQVNEAEREREKVAAVLQIYQELGIADETKVLISKYFADAHRLVQDLEQQAGVRILIDYLDRLMHREA